MSSKDNTQLSKRIIDSGDDIYQQLIDSDYVQKVMMFGVITEDTRAIVHRSYLATSHLMPAFDQTLINALKLKDISSEEKVFFESSLYNIKQKLIKYRNEIEKIFGPIPQQLMDKPQPNVQYYDHFEKASTSGSMIEMLITLVVGYVMIDKIWNYLVNNPSFKPNIIAKTVLFQDFGVDKGIVIIEQFINNRANQFSEDDVEEMTKLYKKTLELELKFHFNNFNGF